MKKRLNLKNGLIGLVSAVAAILAITVTGAFSGNGPAFGLSSTYQFDAASVTTGGSFVTNSTALGTTDTIPAGTYIATLNAKVAPAVDGSGSVQVFPGLFLYNQERNSDFTGDLLNICNGPLEWGANYQIDGYCSGTATIKLDSATPLYVYAFGYDSDRGVGSYRLESADLSLTRVLNP